jgi:methylmalonyl-CoA/ethylmalonyl-CoA epimerase
MITGVHHLTVLVKDLDEAIRRFKPLFGNTPPIRESLESRGVVTARFPCGSTWFVLVQPVADGVPARMLAERGEGIFLLSLSADPESWSSLSAAGDDDIPVQSPPRKGLEGWDVLDLDGDYFCGVPLQITAAGALAAEN